MLVAARKIPAPHFLVGCDVRVLVQAIGVERWVRDGMVSSHSVTGREGGEAKGNGGRGRPDVGC